MTDLTDAKLEQDLLNKGNVYDVDIEDHSLVDHSQCDPLGLDRYTQPGDAAIRAIELTNEEMISRTKAKIFELLSTKLTDMFIKESHLVKPAYQNTDDKYFDMMVREMTERVRVYADMKHMNDMEAQTDAINTTTTTTAVPTIHSINNYILEFETSNEHTKEFADLLVDVISQYDLNNKLADTFITVSLVVAQKYLNIMNEIGWKNVVSYGILVPGKKDKEVTWSSDYGRYYLPIKTSILIKSTPVYLRTFYIYAIANG